MKEPSLQSPCAAGDGESHGEHKYLLDILDEGSVSLAYAHGTHNRYQTNDYLVRQGAQTDGIHVILGGTVESLYESRNGRNLILATWQAGDLIGAPHILGDHQHTWSARAVGKVEALHLDQGGLRRLIAESHLFATALIECLGYKGERYSKLAQVLATHKASERLALLLWELVDASAPNGGLPKIKKIRQDKLAQMIGATRQSVSGALLEFGQRGILSVGISSFFINDLAELKRIASVD